jgi:hypothetical protein
VNAGPHGKKNSADWRIHSGGLTRQFDTVVSGFHGSCGARLMESSTIHGDNCKTHISFPVTKDIFLQHLQKVQ